MPKPIGPVTIVPVTAVTGLRATCTRCNWVTVRLSPHEATRLRLVEQDARAHAAEHERTNP